MTRTPILALPLLLGGIAMACASPESAPTAAPTQESAVAQPEAVPPAPTAEVAPETQRLRGPHIRVVWTRDVGDGTDFISLGNRLVLMAYDSTDGAGERVVLDQPASYARPLVSPSSAEIVFSVREEGRVYAVEWNGARRRPIADGFALTVWPEPGNGREWVYIGTDRAATDPPSYRSVRRYRLDDPGPGELVWDAQPVSGDSFQLSADGRYAGALLPWPQAGIADLQTGTWEALGDGCWTSFSGDGSDLFWYFDGSHRNLTMVDMETDRRWQVSINTAPGIDGFEVYHPRWTNDSRFLVMTGPYTVGRRANRIRGGGAQVEIWLGRFSADFSSVEQWTQVTHNDAPDFYPDAWIAPGDRTTASARGRPAAESTDAPDSGQSRRLVVEARTRSDVPVPTPQSIAPYRNGLQALEYEVLDVIEGRYDADILVIAHWVIRDREVLPEAERPAGTTHRLTVELYDNHPELEGERLVMDSTAFTLPLYYDVGRAP